MLLKGKEGASVFIDCLQIMEQCDKYLMERIQHK